MLQELRGKGLLESTGSFTVDFDRALLHQRARRLADPSFFVLKLVQWAVASQATRIEVTCSRRSVVLQHDGLLPTSEELARLLSYATSASCEPIRELAVGVNAALGLPAKVSVLATGSNGGRLMNLSPTAPPELLGLPSTGDSSGVRISRVSVRRSLPWHVLKGPEARLVEQRCRWAPATLVVDGKPVPRHGWFGSPSNPARSKVPRISLGWHDVKHNQRFCHSVPIDHHVLELRFHQLALNRDRFWLLPSCATQEREGFWDSCSAQAESSLFPGYALALALPANAPEQDEGKAVLHLVWRGVILQEVELDSPLAGVVGILSAQDMTFDLSEFSVVRDQAYARIMDRVCSELASLRHWLSPSRGRVTDAIARVVEFEYRKNPHKFEPAGDGRTTWRRVSAPDEWFQVDFPGQPQPTLARSDVLYRFAHREREFNLALFRLEEKELRVIDRVDLWAFTLDKLRLPVGSLVEKGALRTIRTDKLGGIRCEQVCVLRLSSASIVLKSVVDSRRLRLVVLQVQAGPGQTLERKETEVEQFFVSLKFRS